MWISKELIVEDFFFNIINFYSGHFPLVWPGLLHFEHFLTALEPLAGCWKLQLACCRTSCSAPEETKILRQANFISRFVNYKLMMCHFLVLTESWFYPYFACTCANTLSSPPQNKFIGIYSIIEMKHTCWEKLSADSLSMFLFVCFYCCFLINTTTELGSEGFWSPGRISVKNLFDLLCRQI